MSRMVHPRTAPASLRIQELFAFEQPSLWRPSGNSAMRKRRHGTREEVTVLPPILSTSGLALYLRIQFARQNFLGHRAHDLIHYFAVFVEQDGGNALNVQLGGDRRIFLNLQFADFSFARVFASQLLDDRGDHAAGTAPSGPAIDQHRNIRLQNLLVKIRVSQSNIFGFSRAHDYLFKSYELMAAYQKTDTEE
jgi:hypothetical protein